MLIFERVSVHWILQSALCVILLFGWAHMAAEQPLVRSAVKQVLPVGRGELSWPPWLQAPLVRDECPSTFGSAPCLGLLLHCLLIYWHPVYFKGEAHPCKRMGTLLGQTCGTRNHYKSNCIFGWRLPSLTLPFSQNTPHCCTCIFPQGRKGNGKERHLVDITLLVQFPNSERWYSADECSIKTE